MDGRSMVKGGRCTCSEGEVCSHVGHGHHSCHSSTVGPGLIHSRQSPIRELVPYNGTAGRKRRKHLKLTACTAIFLAMIAVNRSDIMAVAYPVDQARQSTRLRISKRQTTDFHRSSVSSVHRPALYTFSDNTLRASTPEDGEDQNRDPELYENQDQESSTQQIVDAAVSKLKKKFMKRITRLEDIVSRQEVELYRLRQQCAELREVSEAFSKLLDLLRDSGLESETLTARGKNRGSTNKPEQDQLNVKPSTSNVSNKNASQTGRIIESYDEEIIFGTAPSSVIDAADAAGAAILAAMLGGKQRMLVDVRDAELSSDPETLVQFIELSILPIAAGLEGLKSTRNRVKIVFPKVSQLLEYRRTMALAAPEVVALSTLGFDPVEERDKLVVIVAPEPDDKEGINAMKELLLPSDSTKEPIQQPVVLLNYHMIPFQDLDLDFETAYHLRLLTVQYMSAGVEEEFQEEFKREKSDTRPDTGSAVVDDNDKRALEVVSDESYEGDGETDDEALESAMKHAHEIGMQQGTTRAMVIRAYPRPWHVFVDLSPNTDADYEVAATFDEEPSLDQINYAIVECLEGSEVEDEIVAQQMQQALEEGQLNKISDMISDALDTYDDVEANKVDISDDEDDFDMFEEDSV